MSKKVLFVCLGNACRSQMAEAFAKRYGGDILEVYSAGIKPAGFVHPKTTDVMDEMGIDIRGQTSKAIDPELLSQMDWVVALSDEARDVLSKGSSRARHIYWPIDDPVCVFGKDERVTRAFRMTRDEIEKQVKELIRQIKSSL